MTTAKLPSQAILNECFSYNPNDGVLTWKSRPRSHFISDRAYRTFNGKFAGFEAGYRQVGKKGRDVAIVVKFRLLRVVVQCQAHRIILAMLGVHIPTGIQVDHADMNPYNNRLDNIRLATPGQNNANRAAKKHRIGIHSGLPKGVYKIGSKFMAQIKTDGKTRYLGMFLNPQDANVRYLSEATKQFGEFARG